MDDFGNVPYLPVYAAHYLNIICEILVTVM